MKFCPSCGSKIIDNAKFCSKCGKGISDSYTRTASDNIEEKRNIVGSKKSISTPKLLFNIFLIILFSGSILYYFATDKTKEEEIIDNQPQVVGSMEYPESRFDMKNTKYTVEGDYLILPLDEVLDKKFVRFVYKSPLRDIPLLAYVNEDGNLVTSISMCEPCNSTTFHIKGDELVCNSCGSTWELNTLKEISGSCGKYPPDPIPSKVNGNKILISIKSVENWRRRV